jgi:hypothetical protein
MAALTQAYARQMAGQAPGELADAAADAGPGLEVDVFARLAVALDGAAGEMRRGRAAAKIAWEHCHPIPLATISNTAAGTLNDERWEPRQNMAWHITRVSAQSNQSGGATSVIAAQDSTEVQGGYNLYEFPPPGTTVAAGAFLGTWEPKGLFLLPGNRLVFATIAGGATINGQAIEIAVDWLPTYLM